MRQKLASLRGNHENEKHYPQQKQDVAL